MEAALTRPEMLDRNGDRINLRASPQMHSGARSHARRQHILSSSKIAKLGYLMGLFGN